MKCEVGRVSSNDTNALLAVGYDFQQLTANSYQSHPVCLPMPCQWFFTQSEQYFNPRNFRKNNKCSCDVLSGWIPSLDQQACIPLFQQKKFSKHEESITLPYTEVAQSIHRYSFMSQIRKEIVNILNNSNTKDASKAFIFKNNMNFIVGEKGINSFSVIAKRKLFNLSYRLHSQPIKTKRFFLCKSFLQSPMLCYNEKHELQLNPYQHTVSGIHWFDEGKYIRASFLTSSDALKNLLLKKI